ncbi:hypothetical protein [Sinorhizobium sp. BJ1]|uniref:hypothetical protein n=1 Tax=Sinorhizobium sp. BJ1 TaxID=2035455 RepID=UPI000BE82DF3|nr:hypothetical protein [Sinorhizobium sp. BJ1]PDT79969.1 hypothetical protein CO676_30445 [Sinorhizobium sp. BJ1]UYE95862.1 hypothetical protein KNLIENLN_00050 [Sinorhizobium phage NV1.1.1]
MARPRTPKAKAKITGHADKQKTKFEERHEPDVAETVGEPFEWLNEHAQQAWREIASEVPWLNWSHRGHLAIAANIRGRMMKGDDVGVQAMNLLRQCYGQMGATPADASKAGAKPDGESKDPADEFFND